MKTLIPIRRCLLLYIIYSVILGSPLNAEQSESKTTTSGSRLHKGSISLDFRKTYRMYLTSFSGSFISGKYQCSDKSALRCGVTVNYRHDERALGYNRYRTEYDVFVIKIIAQYLHYLASNKKISPYYALGPMINYTRYELTAIHRSLQRNIYAGFQINWGVEWFVTKSISLVAEYGASFIFHGWDDNNTYYIGYERPDGIDFNLKSNPVNFGLSVYF